MQQHLWSWFGCACRQRSAVGASKRAVVSGSTLHHPLAQAAYRESPSFGLVSLQDIELYSTPVLYDVEWSRRRVSEQQCTFVCLNTVESSLSNAAQSFQLMTPVSKEVADLTSFLHFVRIYHWNFITNVLCTYGYRLCTLISVPCFHSLTRPCSVAGFGASLAKDMPFAALYWSLLEPTRATVLRYIDRDSPPAEDRIRPSSELLCANIASAGVLHTIHIMSPSAIYIPLCRV